MRWLERRAAERRWRAHNAVKRQAGCPCGKPGTEVRYDHDNLGNVPVEIWTCAEHVGVKGWQSSPGQPSTCSTPIAEYWAGPIGGPMTHYDGYGNPL